MDIFCFMLSAYWTCAGKHFFITRQLSLYCLVDELRQGCFVPCRRKKNKNKNLHFDSGRRKKKKKKDGK